MNPFSMFLEGRRQRLSARDLKAMPPELLLDIGIEPDQIDAVLSRARRAGPKAFRSYAPAFAAPGLSNSAWPYPRQGVR